MKITVVTVCYNCASEIEATIQSVINQTYKDIEYIIIDGASKDGTLDIINRYADRITKIVSEPDQGVYDAMNKAIDLATGDWINFMNAGDTFYDENVVKRSKLSNVDNSVPAVFGSTIFYNKITSKSILKRPSTDGLSKYMPGCHQSTFVRSSYLKNCRFDIKYKLIADFCFFYSLYKYNNNYLIIPVTISIYDDGGMSSSNKKVTREYIRFLWKQRDITIFRLILRYLRHYVL